MGLAGRERNIIYTVILTISFLIQTDIEHLVSLKILRELHGSPIRDIFTAH
jgi:hypothetical protein